MPRPPDGDYYHLSKRPIPLVPSTGREDIVSVTVGDLHGNFLRLLHFLVLHAVIEISEFAYQAFVSDYYSQSAMRSKEDFDSFCDRLQHEIQVITPTITVRYIGDTLADRGANDLYTLMLFKKLNESGVPQRIILSNHDMEFIMAYEQRQWGSTGMMQSTLLPADQTKSLVALQNALIAGICTEEAFESCVDDHYLPIVQVFDIEISEATREIFLFNHAPFDHRLISALSYVFRLPMHLPIAPSFLKQRIDTLNLALQRYVTNRTLHTLYLFAIDAQILPQGFEPACIMASTETMQLTPMKEIYKKLRPAECPLRDSAEGRRLAMEILLHAVYNRRRDNLIRPGHPEYRELYPEYTTIFVNGHDRHPSSPQCYELDALFGSSGEGCFDEIKGGYPSLCTTRTPGAILECRTQLVKSPEESTDSEATEAVSSFDFQ